MGCAGCEGTDQTIMLPSDPAPEGRQITTQQGVTSPFYGAWESNGRTYTYDNSGRYILEYGTKRIDGYYHYQPFFGEYYVLLSCVFSKMDTTTGAVQPRSECTNRIVQLTSSYYVPIFINLAFTEYLGDCDGAINKTKTQDMTIDLASEVFMSCSYTQKFIDALQMIEYTFEPTSQAYLRK